MSSRYENRRKIVLYKKNETYKNLFENRIGNNISIYSTPSFSFDDTNKNLELEFIEVIWSDGDRLYKLSHKYYNSVEYWWVIGFFNQKPTDSHYSTGDLVLIPTPLEKALEFIGEE